MDNSRHRGPGSFAFSGLSFPICKMATADLSWEHAWVTRDDVSIVLAPARVDKSVPVTFMFEVMFALAGRACLTSTPASNSRKPPPVPCWVQATSPWAGLCRPRILRSYSRASHEDLTERHGSEQRFPKQNFNSATRKHSSRRNKAQESTVHQTSFLQDFSEPSLAANQRGCLRCRVGCLPNTHSWA